MSSGDREARLDALRQEAARKGAVSGAGVEARGGPLPAAARPGYYGRPVVKPPVWTWEVPAYLFVGGASGMAAVLALASLATGASVLLSRAALWLAAAGALVSPLLLTLDLGRPWRFLYMLRVFKRRSPMSVGAWVLVAFAAFALAAVAGMEAFHRLAGAAVPRELLRGLLLGLVGGAAATGALLATYTGVLLGATAVPAWFVHRRSLPVHFGIAGLGSAAAILELAGFRTLPLYALGFAAAAVESLHGARLARGRRGAADGAVRQGRSGALIRTASLLAGPVALLLRLSGWVGGAAASFLLGALLGRFAWLEVGRSSARDPAAALAAGRAPEVGPAPASGAGAG